MFVAKTLQEKEASAELNGQRWLAIKLRATSPLSRKQGQHGNGRHGGDRIRPVSKALLLTTVLAAMSTASAALWALIRQMVR